MKAEIIEALTTNEIKIVIDKLEERISQGADLANVLSNRILRRAEYIQSLEFALADLQRKQNEKHIC